MAVRPAWGLGTGERGHCGLLTALYLGLSHGTAQVGGVNVGLLSVY